jgi:hypothetical protein
MWPYLAARLTRSLATPRFALAIPIALTLGLAIISHAATAILSTLAAVSPAAETPSFPDSPGASVGFTSIPTARALFKSPRWIAAAQAPAAILAQTPVPDRLALAVLGMPVDTGHEMLRGTTIKSDCPSAGKSVFSACNSATQGYERVSSGRRFNLCDYDEDCWHSTAVALLALGNAAQPSPFDMPGQQASAKFVKTTFAAIAHSYYADYSSGFDPADGGERAPSFQSFLRERFSGFGQLMDTSLPVAKLTYGGDVSHTTYITKQIVFERGVDPGAPLLAINVFTEIADDATCTEQRKSAPCLLATNALQKVALGQILNGDPTGGGARLRVSAIVIIAGGYLTSTRCDQTETARLIAALRRRGIPTFVAAGNDGQPTQVRFPACASQAIAIGSLTRDGAIAPSSNGARTGMVSLYVDGETVVMPIRGPRVLAASAGAMEGGAQSCQGDSVCQMRAPGDQYDAYLAGGTLLSTAVASGVYLSLRQRYPSAPPETVLSALRSSPLSSNPAFAEVDERAAAQRLAANAQHP